MRGSKPEGDKRREHNNKETMVEENMLRKEKEERAEHRQKKCKTMLNRSDFCLLSLLSVELTVQYSNILYVSLK